MKKLQIITNKNIVVGIPFILYNTARIAAIIKKYNEGISNGEYPELTNIEAVDFSVLDDEVKH